MPDKIEQQLGIDAGAAIQALDTLNQTFKEFGTIMADVQSKFASFNNSGKTVVDQMRTMASQAGKTATALGKLSGIKVEAPQLPKADVKTILGPSGEVLSQVMVDQTKQASQQIETAVKRIGPAVKQSTDEGKKAAASFIVSWETMGRVVSTQLIVRAMSQIRDAFRASISEAIAFERSVAQIQTIGGGAGFDQIADGVAKIASNFNIPLLEAAAGTYQAISNQVGDFTTSLEFTAEAAKFAKATNSSLADSIDLISGVMKSYNMDVDDTQRISGILFTAIDKGRVTADELANSFGRIGPAAAQIGISAEELSAALATISVKGSATSESITQLRGVITALTKPTDAMTTNLEKLGFATPEAAVGARGLAGILGDLAAGAENGAVSLAEMFPNIRGLGGAISLTSDDLRTMIQTLDDANGVLSNFTDEKYGMVIATDAEQLTKAVNNVKVAITTGFGQAFLDVTASIARFTGAVNGVPPALTSLTGAVSKVAVVFGTASLAAWGFSRTLNLLKLHPVIATLSLVTTGILAFGDALDYIDAKILEKRMEPVKDFAEASQKRLDELKQTHSEEMAEVKKAVDERLKLVREGIQKEGQAYFERVNAARESEKAILDAVKGTLQQVIAARKQVVDELQRGIDDAANRIRQADFTIQSLQQQRSELEFKKQTQGLAPDRQAAMQLQRGTQQAATAARDYLAAIRSGSQEAERAAQAQFDLAANTLRAAEATARQAGDEGLIRHTQQAQINLLKNREAAEKRVKDLIASRAPALEKELATQKKIPLELEKLAAIIEKNSRTFDESGQPLSKEAIKRQEAILAKTIPQFVAKAQEQLDTVRLKDLGIDNLIKDAQSKLSATKIAAAISADQASIAEMRETIKGGLAGIEIEVRAKIAEVVRGEGAQAAGSPDEANRDLNLLDDLKVSLEEKERAATRAGAAFKEAFGQLNASIKAIDLTKLQDAEKLSQAFFESGEVGLFGNRVGRALEIQPELQEVTKILQDFITKGDLSAQAIDKVQAKIKALGELNLNPKQRDEAQIQTAINQLNELERKQQALNQAELQFNTEGGKAKLQEIDGLMDQLGNRNVGKPMAELGTAASAAQGPVAAIDASAQSTAAAYERAAQAMGRLSTMAPPPITAAFGRFVMPKYRAAGGPIGTDTIPAWLSPREMVINARSSRQFFSQLQAINAGRQPVYREHGGSVTNVGDINVTVQGGQYTEMTARKMARELQREMRRGSSRL